MAAAPRSPAVVGASSRCRGALHIEPGLWVTQPPTTYPEETTEPGDQLIFRMGSIAHGSALLAEGTATTFTGTPTLPDGKVPHARDPDQAYAAGQARRR